MPHIVHRATSSSATWGIGQLQVYWLSLLDNVGTSKEVSITLSKLLASANSSAFGSFCGLTSNR